VQLFRLRIYATSGQSVKRIEALHPLQKLLQHVATICSNQIWPKSHFTYLRLTHIFRLPFSFARTNTKCWPLGSGVNATLAKNGCTFPVLFHGEGSIAWQTMPSRRLRNHAHLLTSQSLKSRGYI